jgi:glycosyltransferase involved in cell wall biosynthesis
MADIQSKISCLNHRFDLQPHGNHNGEDMRICLFTSTFLPKIGGHEIAMDELAHRFHAMGHETVVLSQTGSRWRQWEVLERPFGLEWFSKPLSQKWGIGTFRRALRRLHRRWPFDVIHTFSSYPTGYAALDLSEEKSIPLIVTSQGGDLAAGSRYEDRPVIMDRIRQTLLQCDAVTAISQYMRQRALAIAPECASHLHDIPNGVDIADLSIPVADAAEVFQQFPFLKDARFALFLGRLHPRKGVDVLIKAFAQIAGQIGSAQLIIAGDGRDRQALQALAQSTSATDRIHFLGPVRGVIKRWLLHQATCLVAPTRTWEGMPVVVLEALACGRPVIGTNVGGIVDLVRADENGLIVEPEDVPGLAAALANLLNDPDRIARLGAGAKRSIGPYDWHVVAEQYLALFRQLTSRTVQHS